MNIEAKLTSEYLESETGLQFSGSYILFFTGIKSYSA